MRSSDALPCFESMAQLEDGRTSGSAPSPMRSVRLGKPVRHTVVSSTCPSLSVWGARVTLALGCGWMLCCSVSRVRVLVLMCHAQCVWVDVASLLGRVRDWWCCCPLGLCRI